MPHSEFQASLGYRKPSFEKKASEKRKNVILEEPSFRGSIGPPNRETEAHTASLLLLGPPRSMPLPPPSLTHAGPSQPDRPLGLPRSAGWPLLPSPPEAWWALNLSREGVSQVVVGEERDLGAHSYPHGMGHSCQNLAGNQQVHSLKIALLSLCLKYTL